MDFLRAAYQVSIRRACAVLKANRGNYHYKSVKSEQAALKAEIKEVAATRVRYGYRRIHTLLKREGWQVSHGVELDFSRPGKPTDNAFIEAFNSRFRQECLDTAWFLSLNDAKSRIEDWRMEYNTSRPHSAIGNIPPAEFARLSALASRN